MAPPILAPLRLTQSAPGLCSIRRPTCLCTPLHSVSELDRAGHVIGINTDDSVGVWLQQRLTAAQLRAMGDYTLRDAVQWLAGGRQRLVAGTRDVPTVRMLDDNFYGVPQAVAGRSTTRIGWPWSTKRFLGQVGHSERGGGPCGRPPGPVTQTSGASPLQLGDKVMSTAPMQHGTWVMALQMACRSPL